MKPTKSNKKKVPLPANLQWLVDSRYHNQSVSSKLYSLVHKNKICWENNDLGYDAKTLISIGFSLWRAAFLADKSDLHEDTSQDAIWFLGEVLETNAIAFPQDRNGKNFTFNYYIANVRFRLAEYKKDHADFAVDACLLERGKLSGKSPRQRWRDFQDAFHDAVDHYERRLLRTKLAR